MNTRNIQPIASWSPTLGDVTISELQLTDFFHYHFDEGSGKVSYSLNGLDPLTNSTISFFSGVIDIPSEIIQQWGADDTIIWDYTAQALNLTIIN
jgi:hypothetical protein